ncbi:MAG: hypothetical protein RSC41_07070, partial [Oscillospiraceae bacterium]
MKSLKILSLIIAMVVLFQSNMTFVYSSAKCTCDTTTEEHLEGCPLYKKEVKNQYISYVRNGDELLDAIQDEKVTDIQIMQNISISDTIKINKNLVITGNGYSISHNEYKQIFMESIEQKTDNIAMFEINGDVDVDFYSLKIVGGAIGDKSAWGIYNNTSGILRLNNVTIENCFSAFGGAAINSQQGTVIINECNFNKNLSKNNVSTIFNNGTMIIDASSITENISFCKDGMFGGAIKSTPSSKLYINNSTVAKNVSMGNGGGIDIDGGELYALNNNIIGNIALNTTGKFRSSGINFESQASGKLVNNILIGNYAEDCGNSDLEFLLSDITMESDCSVLGYYNTYTDKNTILKDKSNNRTTKKIESLVATERSSIFPNLWTNVGSVDKELSLPIFIMLPNNVNVVGVKSDTEFSDGRKTVFDYDDIDNIICGYIKNKKLYFIGGTKDYNMNIVTTVQGGGIRQEGLVGSTIFDNLIDNNLATVSVSNVDGGHVAEYDFFGKAVNKNEVISLTAVADEGYSFVSWHIDEATTKLVDSEQS